MSFNLILLGGLGTRRAEKINPLQLVRSSPADTTRSHTVSPSTFSGAPHGGRSCDPGPGAGSGLQAARVKGAEPALGAPAQGSDLRGILPCRCACPSRASLKNVHACEVSRLRGPQRHAEDLQAKLAGTRGPRTHKQSVYGGEARTGRGGSTEPSPFCCVSPAQGVLGCP